MSAAPVKKGRGFRGSAKPVEKLPESLREREEEVQLKPRAAASIFEVASKPVKHSYGRSASSPTIPTAKKRVEAVTAVKEAAVEEAEEEVEEEVAPVKASAAAALGTAPTESLDEDTEKMIDLIRDDKYKNRYTSKEGPAVYVPETRRGFSEFIKVTYDSFSLKPGVETKPGENYPYQKFVREYMRGESPYRGILTYHGLGSGKTCTAIATAEALFSTANKKIIVMTPKSLRRNFLNEVTLCGFRHFRLKNYWTSVPIGDSTTDIFSTDVLNIPKYHLNRVKRVWIPDFRKTEAEANYSSLSAEEQTEIRTQILATIAWDEVRDPEGKEARGRIQFINYNGITAKRLQGIACKKPYCDFFDDAVIVIDEIHNLIRLMQGTIDPYLIKLAGMRRLIAPEKVGPTHWKPALCDGTKTYMRGYMFYRLLLAARNSKIVGLSGTPLINFPEELGILANVLHGYIPEVSLTVNETGEVARSKCKAIALAFPFSDFVEVKQTSEGMGTLVKITLLPYGVRKISNDKGVERMSEKEEIPTIDTIVDEFVKLFTKQNLQVLGKPAVNSIPLLPPFGEEFRKHFIAADSSGLNEANKVVLVKRLTGLISYYKGSNEKLMPRVDFDRVVRVPMSAYSQHGYMTARLEEVSKEKKPKDSAGGLSAIWGEVYEIAGKSQTANYKMASRQACNFTFPSNVVRPKLSKKEQRMEANRGNVKGDIVDKAQERDETAAESFPELDAVAAADEAEAARAEAEDEIVEGELFGLEGEAGPVAGPAVPKPPIKFSATIENEFKALDPLFVDNLKITDRGSGVAHVYKSAMHFYQAKKYMGKNEDLAQQILNAETPEEAMTLGETEEGKLSDEESKSIMKAALKVKLVNDSGSGVTINLLLRTGKAELIYVSSDPFWGNVGQNQIGKLWMDLRKENEGAEDLPELQGGGGDEDVVQPSTVSKGLVMKKATNMKSLCETGRQPGEKPEVATQRAKECLETLARDKMKLGPEGLGMYSPKYTKMLENIGEIAKKRGSSLVYSAFLDLEGLGIFKIAMDVNGYAPIEVIKSGSGYKFSKRTEDSLRKGPGNQPRYITFSGGEEDDVRRISLDIFNANFNALPGEPESNIKTLLEELGYTDNKKGQICRVFCITSAGAEGISLKNVRAVHIMEPYWNDVRLRQVKGRAIRIGSHLELEEGERNVAIFTYLSVFSAEAQAATSGDMRIHPDIRKQDRLERKDALALGLPIPEGAAEYVITSDERLYLIAERKKVVLNSLESVMKSAAVDCELNIRENKDGSFKCLPLRGNVGDFMYHPNLEDDIRESASKFKRRVVAAPVEEPVEAPVAEAEAEPVKEMPVSKPTTEAAITEAAFATTEEAAAPVTKAPAPVTKAPAPVKAPVAAPGLPAFVLKEFRGTVYRMKYIRPSPTAPATGFEMYAENDTDMKAALGTAGVQEPAVAGKEKPGKPVVFFK